MRLKVLSDYRSKEHEYLAGREIDVQDGVGEWLLRDSPESFKRLDKPPADKQITGEGVIRKEVDGGVGTSGSLTVRVTRKDDLTSLVGVGETTVARLAELGVTSFAGLLEADPSQLAEQLPGASASKIEAWQKQATEILDSREADGA